jgi:nuclear cap-binding protein subunit 2
MNVSIYSNIQHDWNIKKFYQYYSFAFKASLTVYIGNLSYTTSEEQVFALFNHIGKIKRIIMGLHKIKKNSCGFYFLEFFNFKDVKFAYHVISGYRINKKILRIDLDRGFSKGREFGRGKKGGQIIEEFYLCKSKNKKCLCIF